MGNSLIIGANTYTDALLMIGAHADMANAMVADELAIDTLELDINIGESSGGGSQQFIPQGDSGFDTIDGYTLYVLSNQGGIEQFIPLGATGILTSDGYVFCVQSTSGGGADIEALLSLTYAQPMLLYHNDLLIGKFYFQNLKRNSKKTMHLSAVSLVGILDKIPHKGGIYTGETAQTVLTDLMAGYSVTIHDDVKNVTLYGWLPYATCRENLHQVLFALGASLFKDANGNLLIKNMTQGTPTAIPNSKIYAGGKITYNTKATAVDVTEHSYYALNTDEERTLFDNTNGNVVTNQLVTFQNPCHDLTATGLTISESGVNYAIVSGTGKLVGKEYTHTTQTISNSTGVTGESHVVEVKDATMVSALNSQNVSKRLGGYYSSALTVDMDVIMDANLPLKPATEVSFTDPYGDARRGFVKELDVTLSQVLKGTAKIDTGWTPSHFGNNYNGYALIDQSGTVTVPEGVTSIRAILIGGGQGGKGGENGAKGEDGANNHSTAKNGGEGGDGGTGGTGGKVLAVDIDLGGQTSFSLSVGQGGAGGASATEGSSGTATTLTINGVTYTSEDGDVSPTGVINPITGDVFGLSGEAGTKGGAGGGNNTYEAGGNYYVGESVGEYAGGSGGTGDENTYSWSQTSGGTTTYYSRIATALGGSGGGACATGSGSNGTDGSAKGSSSSKTDGGDGGAGASPTARAAQNTYGNGGDGGHGGGGGGVGGNTWAQEGIQYQSHPYISWGDPGTGGTGGSGGQGGTGGPGCLIYLY